MGGSPGIGVFTRITRGCAGVACARASSSPARRLRRGPGALAGPDAPGVSPSL